MVGILWSRSRLAGIFLLSLTLVVGCSSNPNDKLGNISGKVTVDGAPANSGSVVFTAANGTTISGSIDPDGSYRAIGVPPGAAQVAVISAPAPTGAGTKTYIEAKKDAPGGSGAGAKPIPIPAKYATAAGSGLTFPVKSGENTFPIALTK